jgi:ATP-dependent Clp protease, protease subunit
MGRPVKDWDAVEAYFDYGLDVQNRRVFLLGDVEESPIGNAIKGIYYLDGHPLAQKQKPDIELFIGSFGGELYEMFGLYDVLNSISSPITTVAIGKCMSATPLLIAAGTRGKRYSMPNTQWMLHMASEGFDTERIDSIKKHVDHTEGVLKTWWDLLATHSKKTAAQWRRICKNIGDSYFDADQAQEWGLVDHLWDEKGGHV